MIRFKIGTEPIMMMVTYICSFCLNFTFFGLVTTEGLKYYNQACCKYYYLVQDLTFEEGGIQLTKGQIMNSQNLTIPFCIILLL